jgi:hypothetical protein
MTPAPVPFEHFDDLSPAETQFRELLWSGQYPKWAKSVRRDWSKTPSGLRAALALKGSK